MQNKFPGTLISLCGLAITAVIAVGALGWSASISQRTEGECSPAVADVKGDVTIICKGIDPSISNELIRLMNEILKDTKKLEQLRQELDKISKRTEEIQARQASRRLSQTQRNQLVSLLVGKSDNAHVEVDALSNNAEAMQFAKDIGYTLLAAGWKVEGINWVTTLGVDPIGVYLWIKDPNNPSPSARILLESLRAISLDVIIRASPNAADNRIGIWVASKPL